MIDWKIKLEKIRSNLARLFSYTLPIKLIFGFFLTALGSASVLGLLSEFAVYKYALVNGFRVPVEGIPYLKPTVTLISLIAITVALLGFFITYLFTKFTVLFMSAPKSFARKILFSLGINKSSFSTNVTFYNMKEISIIRVLFISVLSSIFVTIIVYNFFNADDLFGVSFIENMQDSKDVISSNPIIASLFIFSISFIMYFTSFRPTFIKPIAFSIALLSTVSVLFIMFNTKMYSTFLYTTGFGGERPVTLFSNENKSIISGKLLIQSNDYYIILGNDFEVIEFPVKNVSKIQYKQTKHTWI